jgi:hypothetical protein
MTSARAKFIAAPEPRPRRVEFPRQRQRRCRPGRPEPFSQFKGFAGGVPPNTEITAVKPRVDSASCQEVFVLSWSRRTATMANRHQFDCRDPGPFNFCGGL